MRWRRGSCISAGPVAQLSPMTSTPRGSIEDRAAAISVPGSMRPVSSMVTWAWIGRLPSHRRHRPAASVDRRPQRQQVEHGLDDEQVDSAVEQPLRLDLVGVAHLGIADLAERGELGAGADGARHPPGASGGGELVGDPSGDGCAGSGQLVGAVADAVLTERDGERSEGVGLDHVDPGGEEGTMEVLDDVGAGDVEQLVAPLEGGAAEVVGGRARPAAAWCRWRRRRSPPGCAPPPGSSRRHRRDSPHRAGTRGFAGWMPNGHGRLPSRSCSRSASAASGVPASALIGQALAPFTSVAAASQGLSLHRSG